MSDLNNDARQIHLLIAPILGQLHLTSDKQRPACLNKLSELVNEVSGL